MQELFLVTGFPKVWRNLLLTSLTNPPISWRHVGISLAVLVRLHMVWGYPLFLAPPRSRKFVWKRYDIPQICDPSCKFARLPHNCVIRKGIHTELHESRNFARYNLPGQEVSAGTGRLVFHLSCQSKATSHFCILTMGDNWSITVSLLRCHDFISRFNLSTPCNHDTFRHSGSHISCVFGPQHSLLRKKQYQWNRKHTHAHTRQERCEWLCSQGHTACTIARYVCAASVVFSTPAASALSCGGQKQEAGWREKTPKNTHW